MAFPVPIHSGEGAVERPPFDQQRSSFENLAMRTPRDDVVMCDMSAPQHPNPSNIALPERAKPRQQPLVAATNVGSTRTLFTDILPSQKSNTVSISRKEQRRQSCFSAFSAASHPCHPSQDHLHGDASSPGEDLFRGCIQQHQGSVTSPWSSWSTHLYTYMLYQAHPCTSEASCVADEVVCDLRG